MASSSNINAILNNIVGNTLIIDSSGLTTIGVDHLHNVRDTITKSNESSEVTVATVGAQFNGTDPSRFYGYCESYVRRAPDTDKTSLETTIKDIQDKYPKVNTTNIHSVLDIFENHIQCNHNSEYISNTLNMCKLYLSKLIIGGDNNVCEYVTPDNYLKISTSNFHDHIKNFFPYDPTGEPDMTQIADMMQYASLYCEIITWRDSDDQSKCNVYYTFVSIIDSIVHTYLDHLSEDEKKNYHFDSIVECMKGDLMSLTNSTSGGDRFAMLKSDPAKYAPDTYRTVSYIAKTIKESKISYDNVINMFKSKLVENGVMTEDNIKNVEFKDLSDIRNTELPLGAALEYLTNNQETLPTYLSKFEKERTFDARRLRWVVLDVFQFMTKSLLPHGSNVDNQIAFKIISERFLNKHHKTLDSDESMYYTAFRLNNIINEHYPTIGMSAIFDDNNIVLVADGEGDDWRTIDALYKIARESDNLDRLYVTLQLHPKTLEHEDTQNVLDSYIGLNMNIIENSELRNSSQQISAIEDIDAKLKVSC